MPDLPVTRIEPELLVLHELAAQLDEIRGLERTARAEFRMIAPNAQRHSIARIGERELAVRFSLASRFGRARFHLDMHPRFHDRAVLRVATDFAKAEKLHSL